MNGIEDGDEANMKDAKIGGPALQAKTDAAVKEVEVASGTTMGEPARQAKRDAIESKVNAAIDD